MANRGDQLGSSGLHLLEKLHIYPSYMPRKSREDIRNCGKARGVAVGRDEEARGSPASEGGGEWVWGGFGVTGWDSDVWEMWKEDEGGKPGNQ